MLVVISDLHFQDTINDVIKDEQGHILVDVHRNIFHEAFETTFEEFWSFAKQNKATELIIVLAGDIFDLNRSRKWCDTDIRPYGEHPPDQWGPIAMEIFDDIVESTRQTFDFFTQQIKTALHNNIELSFRYIPGNHDRLINLYEPLRKKVSDLLGLDGEETFDHVITMERYGVQIRHGHEYDPFNFAGDIPKNGPFTIADKDYALAPFGDYVTIDFAARLAYEYRRRYEKNIQSGADAEIHRLIYRKFLEFDDLRPLSAIKAFLEAEMPDRYQAWNFFVDFVMTDALPRALGSNFVRNQLGLLKIYLLRVVKLIAPQLLIDFLLKSQSARHDPWYLPQREHMRREPILNNPQYRFVVSGHTHNPEIEYLRRREDGKELFFFDTGTWRQQIGRCSDNKTFARAKTLTYVVFYSADEDPPREGGNKGYSFDYWSGFTKKEIPENI